EPVPQPVRDPALTIPQNALAFDPSVVFTLAHSKCLRASVAEFGHSRNVYTKIQAFRVFFSKTRNRRLGITLVQGLGTPQVPILQTCICGPYGPNLGKSSP